MSKALSKIDTFKSEISSSEVQKLFVNSMKENSSSFIATIIDIYSSDSNMQECAPQLVINEALKAASLKLPLSKGLGFGYLVAYKGKPQFQIGYRGFIQLAIRSGEYITINADAVYEGEISAQDKLRGIFEFNGVRKSDKVIGYFAHIELKNGFTKTLFMTKEKILLHAKKYSKTFDSSYSPWKTSADEMGIKTVLKNILNHYGTLSVDMAAAFESDRDDEIQDNANTIDISFTEPEAPTQAPTQSPTPKNTPAF